MLRSSEFFIPCDSFLFTFSVRKKEKVTFIEEFYLQLIKECGPIEESLIGKFYGWTPDEVRTITLSLKMYINIGADGSIELSKLGNELFRSSNKPEKTTLETFRKELILDSMDFSEQVKKNIRLNPIIIENSIPIPSNYTGKGNSKQIAAEREFSKRHFYDWKREEDEQKDFHLYLIDKVDIRESRYSNITLGFNIEKEQNGECTLNDEIIGEDIEWKLKSPKTYQNICDHKSTLECSVADGARIQIIEEITNLERGDLEPIRNLINTSPVNILSEIPQKIGDYNTITGAPYLEMQSAELLESIDDSFSIKDGRDEVIGFAKE